MKIPIRTIRAIQTILTASGIALLISHCGGLANTTSAAPDAGTHPGPDGSLVDSGLCEGTAGPGEVPSEHRPTAATCPRSPVEVPVPDGGATTCNTDPDCPTYEHCVEHVCGADACLTDTDCATGNVCVCTSDAGGGNRIPGNVCVPASCSVDSDCGAGSLCVPSRGYCGGVSGYYCSSSKDTCVDPAKDCSCGGNACVYAPMVGHFVCASNVCNG
jgi:hypothetical protein